MSNVQDINSAFAHAIKDPKWIANHGYDADLGSLVRENVSGLGEGALAILVPATAIASLTVGVNLLIDAATQGGKG